MVRDDLGAVRALMARQDALRGGVARKYGLSLEDSEEVVADAIASSDLLRRSPALTDDVLRQWRANDLHQRAIDRRRKVFGDTHREVKTERRLRPSFVSLDAPKVGVAVEGIAVGGEDPVVEELLRSPDESEFRARQDAKQLGKILRQVPAGQPKEALLAQLKAPGVSLQVLASQAQGHPTPDTMRKRLARGYEQVAKTGAAMHLSRQCPATRVVLQQASSSAAAFNAREHVENCLACRLWQVQQDGGDLAAAAAAVLAPLSVLPGVRDGLWLRLHGLLEHLPWVDATGLSTAGGVGAGGLAAGAGTLKVLGCVGAMTTACVVGVGGVAISRHDSDAPAKRPSASAPSSTRPQARSLTAASAPIPDEVLARKTELAAGTTPGSKAATTRSAAARKKTTPTTRVRARASVSAPTFSIRRAAVPKYSVGSSTPQVPSYTSASPAAQVPSYKPAPAPVVQVPKRSAPSSGSPALPTYSPGG